MINNISSITNNASPSTLPSSNQSAADLKNEFMQLLMAQLRNQDPTKPVDSTAMLAQQAQFASLEQMQNMNTNLVTLMAMQNVTQATGLLGRTVTGTDVNGAAVTGIVSGLSFSNGSPTLSVGSTTMALSGIQSVK